MGNENYLHGHKDLYAKKFYIIIFSKRKEGRNLNPSVRKQLTNYGTSILWDAEEK